MRPPFAALIIFGRSCAKVSVNGTFTISAAATFRVTGDRFEGRIGHHERTVEGVRADSQDLAGAGAEQDLVRVHAIVFRERFDQHIRVIVWITTGELEGFGNGREGFGGWTEGILVRVQSHETGGGDGRFARVGKCGASERERSGACAQAVARSDGGRWFEFSW